ncbi:hypothetical protein C8Q77DRAFT_170695 [Trametes polyzona]|nr:hypothetical protein C8Q77DRAFT_170695 [Trametes polyzona]
MPGRWPSFGVCRLGFRYRSDALRPAASADSASYRALDTVHVSRALTYILPRTVSHPVSFWLRGRLAGYCVHALMLLALALSCSAGGILQDLAVVCLSRALPVVLTEIHHIIFTYCCLVVCFLLEPMVYVAPSLGTFLFRSFGNSYSHN